MPVKVQFTLSVRVLDNVNACFLNACTTLKAHTNNLEQKKLTPYLKKLKKAFTDYLSLLDEANADYPFDCNLPENSSKDCRLVAYEQLMNQLAYKKFNIENTLFENTLKSTTDTPLWQNFITTARQIFMEIEEVSKNTNTELDQKSDTDERRRAVAISIQDNYKNASQKLEKSLQDTGYNLNDAHVKEELKTLNDCLKNLESAFTEYLNSLDATSTDYPRPYVKKERGTMDARIKVYSILMYEIAIRRFTLESSILNEIPESTARSPSWLAFLAKTLKNFNIAKNANTVLTDSSGRATLAEGDTNINKEPNKTEKAQATSKKTLFQLVNTVYVNARSDFNSTHLKKPLKNLLTELYCAFSEYLDLLTEENLPYYNKENIANSDGRLLIYLRLMQQLATQKYTLNENKMAGIYTEATPSLSWIVFYATVKNIFNNAQQFIGEQKPVLIAPILISLEDNNISPNIAPKESTKSTQRLTTDTPLLEIEWHSKATATPNDKDFDSWDAPKELNRLIASLKELHSYGAKLKRKAPEKAAQAMRLANELVYDVRLYNNYSTKDRISKKDAFIDDFKKKLHSQDQLFSEHRKHWKVIIANILWALTGIGLLTLSVSLLVRGHGFHSQTNGQRRIDAVDQQVSNPSVAI